MIFLTFCNKWVLFVDRPDRANVFAVMKVSFEEAPALVNWGYRLQIVAKFVSVERRLGGESLRWSGGLRIEVHVLIIYFF